MSRRALIVAGLLCAFVGCISAGSKHFKQGETLRARGELGQAEIELTKATEADPKNERYRSALQSLRAQIDAEVESIRAEASQKERAGDWAGASGAWGRASILRPKDDNLSARKSLTSLKSKNLDPDKWYAAVEALLKKHPDNGIVKRTLSGARAAAYQYNIGLGDNFLDAGDGVEALKYFERAKSIDPSMPGFDPGRLEHAEALKLADEGDLRMTAGEAVAAYELYRQSYEKRPTPRIAKKMARAKSKAAKVLKKLERARSAAARARWKDAVRLYQALLEMPGVPSSVESEATAAKEELAKIHAGDALRYAKRGDLRRGGSSLLEGLEYASFSNESKSALRESVEASRSGEPGRARQKLEGSGAPTASDLYEAALQLALSAAKNQLAAAKRLARRDPSKALVQLSSLQPFASELPEIAGLRRQLLKKSFQGLLDAALDAAKRGDDGEAATLLTDALNASKAPAAMRASASSGAEHLREGRYWESETAWNEALANAPRSRLARRGLDVARMRRTKAEQEAVGTIETGSGDLEAAVKVLEDSLVAAPGNRLAQRAARALLDQVEKGRGKTDLQIARLLGQAARLSELPDAAKGSIEAASSALAQGKYKESDDGFRAVEKSAPSARVAKVGRKLAKSRMLVALKSSAKRAASGEATRESAEAVAKLLAADPDSKEGHRALKEILDAADESARAGNDSEAARLIGLATVASNPAPGVKKALDAAAASLGAGKMPDAERHFGDALDLEPKQPVAETGLALAKRARVEGLNQALADAKGGTGLEAARAALERTLAVDPNSAEAKKAFKELLEQAREKGKAGSDAEAAAFLETANVVSKPETVRKSLTAANDQLKKGAYDKAIADYEKIQKRGRSQVAQAGIEIAKERRLSVLVAGANELQTGGDVERGVEAVAKLIAIDPSSARAKAAIDGALDAAETAAGDGDIKRAAKLLHGVNTAQGGNKGAQKAIVLFEKRKFEQAEAAFAKLSGALPQRAATIARDRRMASLKAGIAKGSGQDAAKSIRAMLQADPSNKEAQAAFNALLTDAASAARKGKDDDASEKLKTAMLASGAAGELEKKLQTAIDALAGSKHAEAERGFADALTTDRRSEVAKTGERIASERRAQAEKAALAKLDDASDPRPHAEVLLAGLAVDARSRAAEEGKKKLLDRASRAAKKGDDREIAAALAAAAILERLAAASASSVDAAGKKLVAQEFAEAEIAYAEVNQSEDGTRSAAAELGQKLSRARRLEHLNDEYDKAQKSKNTQAAARFAQEILDLDPGNKRIQKAVGKLGTRLVEENVGVGLRQRGFGKRGVAHLYFSRALADNTSHATAKKELEAVEKELAEDLNLVILVDKIARGSGVPAHQCRKMEESLRTRLMETGAKNDGLGGYILDPAWTQAVEEKASDAPKVNGQLEVQMIRCQSSPATGKISVSWSLVVPRSGSGVVIKGTAEADVPRGVLPIDEQDGDQANLRKALSKRLTKKIIEALESERSAIDQWPLALAEHAIAKKDAALAAEAYAKLKVKKPSTIDAKRQKRVVSYLDAEFK